MDRPWDQHILFLCLVCRPLEAEENVSVSLVVLRTGIKKLGTRGRGFDPWALSQEVAEESHGAVGAAQGVPPREQESQPCSPAALQSAEVLEGRKSALRDGGERANALL